jgi:hypothetical protein
MGKQSKRKQDKKTKSFVIEGLRQIYRNIRHSEFEKLYLKALTAKRAYEDDPLYPYYEAGVISKPMYRYIWGRVDVDWAFWELVQVVEPVIKRKYRKDGNNYPFKNAADLYLTALNELAFKAGRKRNQALDEKRNLKRNFQSPSGRLMEKHIRELAAYVEESDSLSVSSKRKRQKPIKDTYLKLTGEKLEVKILRQDMPIFILVLETAYKEKYKTIKARYKRWFLSHEDALNAAATIYHSAPKLTIRKGEVQGGISLKSA